ncbi:MAG: hypothetical protein VYA17_02340 [Pseudomonadota bacterium]|nr:hypothetical protein [Pseudomonadota bacterium]
MLIATQSGWDGQRQATHRPISENGDDQDGPWGLLNPFGGLRVFHATPFRMTNETPRGGYTVKKRVKPGGRHAFPSV